MNESKVINADIVAGTQMALVAAIGALLKHAAYKNPSILSDFEQVIEYHKAALLNSAATDRKIAAFETVAQSLMTICLEEQAC